MKCKVRKGTILRDSKGNVKRTFAGDSIIDLAIHGFSEAEIKEALTHPGVAEYKEDETPAPATGAKSAEPDSAKADTAKKGKE